MYDTGVTRQAETDTRGAYLFSNLQLGTYKVTVEAKGFQDHRSWTRSR